jgi:hypothetical protein
MLSWNCGGREHFGPALKYSNGICLKLLRKTKAILNQILVLLTESQTKDF